MEVGLRAEAEILKTGEVGHTASAYLTFVSIDDEGNPREVPPLSFDTEEEERRNLEAQIRKRMRGRG